LKEVRSMTASGPRIPKGEESIDKEDDGDSAEEQHKASQARLELETEQAWLSYGSHTALTLLDTALTLP
jgi:hypothetical protein